MKEATERCRNNRPVMAMDTPSNTPECHAHLNRIKDTATPLFPLVSLSVHSDSFGRSELWLQTQRCEASVSLFRESRTNQTLVPSFRTMAHSEGDFFMSMTIDEAQEFLNDCQNVLQTLRFTAQNCERVRIEVTDGK